MIGVVLLSHGEMAEGMKKSCELFFGDNIANLACCQLYEGMAPETYDKKIDEALKEAKIYDQIMESYFGSESTFNQ